jgi:hypothetical protein
MIEPRRPPDVEEPETAMLGDRNWRIDKHIPLASLLAVGVQTAVVLWWAAGVTFRIDQLEKQAMMAAPQAERLIKLETKFDALIDSVNEVKALLRQPPRPPGG